MTRRSTGLARLRQWLRPLVLALCALSLGIAGQATAADLAVDVAVALTGGVAPAAGPQDAVVDAARDCAPARDKSGGPGHCAACCMHASGQLLADNSVLAPLVRLASAIPRPAASSAPPSVRIAAPERPPQA